MAAQGAERLLCRQELWVQILSTHTKAECVGCGCNLSSGEMTGDRRLLVAHWPAVVARMASTKFNERPWLRVIF